MSVTDARETNTFIKITLVTKTLTNFTSIIFMLLWFLKMEKFKRQKKFQIFKNKRDYCLFVISFLNVIEHIARLVNLGQDSKYCKLKRDSSALNQVLLQHSRADLFFIAYYSLICLF